MIARNDRLSLALRMRFILRPLSAWLLLLAGCGGDPAPMERVPGPVIDAGNASSIAERYTFPAQVAWVSALDFSADEAWVAVGDEQGYIAIFERESGETVTTVGGVRSAAFHPDGRRFASGSFNGVQLWDLPEGENSGTYRKHGEWVNDLDFSTDPVLVVSGSGGPRKEHSVHVWDPDTLETRFEREAEAKVRAVAITGDASLVAWGTTLGRIDLVELESGDHLARIDSDGGNVTALAFAPDAARLASAHADGSIRLWDSGDGGAVAELRGADWIEDLAWNPGGDLLAYGDRKGALRVWDVGADTLRFEQVLAQAPDTGTAAVSSAGAPPGSLQLRITRVAFSPDGRTLAAGLSDGTLRMFEAAGETEAATAGDAGSEDEASDED